MEKVDKKFIRWVFVGMTKREQNIWLEYLPFISTIKKQELYVSIRKKARKQEKLTENILSRMFEKKSKKNIGHNEKLR